MSEQNPWITDTTLESFENDVIERSRKVPVVVDFWAPWCGPCLTLGPTLERLTNEYSGQFILVKVDIEQYPEIAQSFGIRSIPAVFGFRDGEAVDSFVGALPDSAIRTWLDRLRPSPTELLIADARRLLTENPIAAEAKYREAIAIEPDNPVAILGLARALFMSQRLGESRSLIQRLESRGFLEPEAANLSAELLLREQSGDLSPDEARKAVSAHPDDHAARLKLAQALASQRSFVEALEICLGLVERDRKGIGEEARKTMLAIFQALPADSEIADDYRRKLSAALY